MDSLGGATDSIKSALGAVQQLQSIAQTAKGLKDGDIGAIAGAAGSLLTGGGGLGSLMGGGASPAGSAPTGATPGWNPNPKG